MANQETPSTQTKLIASTAGVLGVAALLFFFSPSTSSGPKAGAPAPDFSLTDLGGRTITLAEHKGRVVLLDFWATWCVSCEKEVPELKALHDTLSPDEFALLAISCDDGGPEIVANFAAKHALPYPVLFGDVGTRQRYKIFGLPTKFLIDDQGRVYRKYLANTTSEEIENDIRSLLKRRDS
jgi:peroxiredoxin